MTNYNITRHKDLSFSSSKLKILPIVRLNHKILTKNKTIVFIHQSKTAGTNIDYLMKALAEISAFIQERATVPAKEGISPNLFVEGSIGGLSTIYSDPERFDCKNRDIKFISGHIPLPTIQNESAYLKAEVNYITLVRDPIDRELSLANFAYQRNYIKQEDAVFFILNKTIDNIQTRFLAGEEYMVGECNETTFEAAKQNILNRITLTATTEDVEIVMSILSHHFGFQNIAYSKGQISGMKILTRDNTTLCEELAHKNQFDIRLYDFVKTYWQDWKIQNIEAISDNKNSSVEYLVLVPSFYQTKIVEYMNLNEIEHYGENRSELEMIYQNMNKIITPTASCDNLFSENEAFC